MTATDDSLRPRRGTGIPALLGGWAPAIVLLAFCAWMVRAGMSVPDVAVALAAVSLTQVVPGVLVWRLVRPRDGSWLEDLSIGFAIGAVIAILAQIPAGLLGLRWFSGVLMLLLVVLLLAVPVTRRRIFSARTAALPFWWGPLAALASLTTFTQLLGYIRQTPIAWQSGSRAVHIDSYLHLSLAAELENRGPVRFPWVQSEELGYHWFAHAWMAQVGATSHVELDTILFRFMPLLVPVTIAVAVAAAAVRLSGAAWTGPAAAWLTMLPGMANAIGVNTGRLPETPLSPTLGISAPMLVALVLLLALRWRKEALTGSWLLVPVLALGAAGTKGSTTPLVVAGAALALAMALLWRRQLFVRVAVDLVLTVVGLALAMGFVFRGSGAGLHLSTRDAITQSWTSYYIGADTIPLQLFSVSSIVLGAVSLGAAGLATLFFSPNRRDPLLFLLAGATAAGAGAPGLFGHPGSSQWYFQLNAIPLMALLSVTGLAAVSRGWRRRHVAALVGTAVVGALVIRNAPKVLGAAQHADVPRIVLMTVAAAVVLVLVAAIAAAFSRARRAVIACAAAGLCWVLVGVVVQADAIHGPVAAPAPTIGPRAPLATSRAQIDAARWIRDHSGREDLVMTNRHCTVPQARIGRCDSRRWLVAAYSERQVLLEGWTATPRSAEEGPHGRDSITVAYWHPELQRLNDDFIADPTRSASERLRARGVRWIYVDYTQRHAKTLEPFATLRRHYPGVDVYEFTP